MGEGARKFTGNLGWIGGSFAAAKVISALVNIAAGRLLGPLEYGKINLMVSAGAVIYPFLLIGMQWSLVKYGSTRETRGGAFGIAALTFLTLTLLAVGITVSFGPALSALLGIKREMLSLAFLYAAATAAYMLASGMQQSLENFRARGLGEIGFSVLLAAVFSSCVALLGRAYEAMAWAYIASFGLVALVWWLKARPYISLSRFDVKQFRGMLEYGLYNFGAGLGSFLILNVQGLVINWLFSARDVGIYAAYYTASINIAGYLSYALNTVLFPKASATPDRKRIWTLASKGWLYLAPAAFAVFMLTQAAVLSLMGRSQYGFDPGLASLFALCGTLMMVQGSLSQILLAEGIKGSRFSLFLSVGAGIFNFTACVVLIPHLKVAGVAVSLMMTQMLMLFLLWKVRGKYLA